MPFEKEAIRLLNTAYDNGIRLFDTAPLYGNGYSEAIVGKFLYKKRQDIILSTKFGLNSNRSVYIPAWMALPANYLRKKCKSVNNSQALECAVKSVTGTFLQARKIDKKEIENSFNKSIKVLKTDYIDNFLLHEATPFFLTEDALSFLSHLKKDGKVLKIGVACGSVNLTNHNNFINWDILQYENGPLFNSDYLVNQFPEKIHIYHSVLKGIKNLRAKDIETFELAAILLSYAIKKNPDGKVLFATTKSTSIKENIKAMAKFENLPLAEIKSLIDALY